MKTKTKEKIKEIAGYTVAFGLIFVCAFIKGVADAEIARENKARRDKLRKKVKITIEDPESFYEWKRQCQIKQAVEDLISQS